MSIPTQNYNSDPKGLIPKPARAYRARSKMESQYVPPEAIEGKVYRYPRGL
jgi:hypothetical protein